MGNLLCFLLHLWVILPVNVRLSHIAPNLKTFPWCGGPQNPMEAAKTGRVATAVFFSCKDEVQRLNISSAFIQEVDRMCAVWRLCYAFGEDTNNVTMELYNAAGKCTHKFSQAAMFVFPTWRQKYNVLCFRIKCAQDHQREENA
ncbi:uncharacterized protein LOC142574131 isoform X2 [Dermacentor variabilis]|uniref:uncharacterized protein LOC142574131 isoform X2 n=1 Tax=Dermacentor variabilis TaxID=34621 RepID=UPI003F5BDEE0